MSRSIKQYSLKNKLVSSVLKDQYTVLTWYSQNCYKNPGRLRYTDFSSQTPPLKLVEGRQCFEFICNMKYCKASKGQKVRRFIDSKDRGSTSNMKRHAMKCYGDTIVKKALQSDAMGVRKGLSDQ